MDLALFTSNLYRIHITYFGSLQGQHRDAKELINYEFPKVVRILKPFKSRFLETKNQKTSMNFKLIMQMLMNGDTFTVSKTICNVLHFLSIHGTLAK